jgi:AraC-like DNA-binding protein
MDSLSGSFPFKLLNIEKAILDRQWNYQNVCSPFFRMLYILNGEGFIMHDNKKYSLEAEKLFLIPNFTNCNYHCSNSLEMIYIIFFNQMQYEMQMHNYQNQVFEIKGDNLDKTLFTKLLVNNPNMGLANYDPNSYDNWNYLDSCKEHEKKKEFQHIIENQGILLQLFSRFKASKNKYVNCDNASILKIYKTIQYIHKNLNKNLSVKLLAEKICLSPDYFSRLFQQVTQNRPIDFIQRKRIEKAQFLLVTTNYSLEKIAEFTGLNNSSYLIRLFKRHTGITPKKYRSPVYDKEKPNNSFLGIENFQ